jgi:hypothetical protein
MKGEHYGDQPRPRRPSNRAVAKVVGGFLGFIAGHLVAGAAGRAVPFGPGYWALFAPFGWGFGIYFGIRIGLWLLAFDWRHPRVELRTVFVAVSLLALACGVVIHWPYASTTALRRIRHGMTEQEVVQILGRPDSQTWSHWCWESWPPGRLVIVSFDRNKRVDDAFTDMSSR